MEKIKKPFFRFMIFDNNNFSNYKNQLKHIETFSLNILLSN